VKADPVGVRDIAERLGVKQQTASVWRHRGLLPKPDWHASGLPLWNWPKIEEWARETGRLR
jgi:predicted site-specific integrase-resolvase